MDSFWESWSLIFFKFFFENLPVMMCRDPRNVLFTGPVGMLNNYQLSLATQ